MVLGLAVLVGCPWWDFLVALKVYVAVCSRPRGPASPWCGRVLFGCNSFFGVGRLAFCLNNKKEGKKIKK